MEFLFCHILTPSGTFGVFIVTPKAFDHASVFDALGVRMGWPEEPGGAVIKSLFVNDDFI